MTRLILISSSGYTPSLARGPDCAIPFAFDLVWGKLPSPEKLAAHLGARTGKRGTGRHWSDWGGRWRSEEERRRDLSLIEFCEPYKTIELWFDQRPSDQLHLIWLLDYFSSHPEIASKLRLAIVEFNYFFEPEEGWPSRDFPLVRITQEGLRTAGHAWQAYRSPTPEACFDLLKMDLSAVPQFRLGLLDLLEELPSATTGLGATETRMLELLAAGYANTNPLFHLGGLYRRRVYGEWDMGALLEGLALGPRPAVAGLGEELRTLKYENYRGRHEVYLRSRLSLTDFGHELVAQQADFSRHNPIHRWWGGTELTSDRLWRYTPVLMKP